MSHNKFVFNVSYMRNHTVIIIHGIWLFHVKYRYRNCIFSEVKFWLFKYPFKWVFDINLIEFQAASVHLVDFNFISVFCVHKILIFIKTKYFANDFDFRLNLQFLRQHLCWTNGEQWEIKKICLHSVDFSRFLPAN